MKKLLVILLCSLASTFSFAATSKLVNNSAEDILTTYAVCTFSQAPQPSDCSASQSIMLPAGKITLVQTPVPKAGQVVDLFISHTQNADAYGNYEFITCDANPSHNSAAFTITDGSIFCTTPFGK